MSSVILHFKATKIISLIILFALLNNSDIYAQLLAGPVAANAANECLIGNKYRGVRPAGSAGDKEIYLGAEDINISSNRSDNNLSYQSQINFTLIYDAGSDVLINYTYNGNVVTTTKNYISGAIAHAGKRHTPDQINYLEIESYNETDQSTIEISNLFINGQHIPGTYSNSSTGSNKWHAYSMDLGSGFTIEGTINLIGDFGSDVDKNFVQLRLGYSASALSLPLSWNNISLEKNNSSVDIKWSTLQEVNTDRFEIQRSGTGSNFTTLGSVTANGNSNIVQQYKFTDLLPINGYNYYRIKQIDRNGHFTYSTVVAINMRNKQKEIVTLNGNNILVQFSNTAKRTIELLNMNGVVIKRTSGSNSVYELNNIISGRGIHVVRVIEEDGDAHSTQVIL
jgi:hypothetical protein